MTFKAKNGLFNHRQNFVLDNLDIVLDKKYFVLADGGGKNSRKCQKYWFLHLFYFNKSRQICLYLGSLFSQKLTCHIIKWNILINCLPLTFKFENIRIKGWIFSVLAENSSLSDQNMETLPNKFVEHGDKYLSLLQVVDACLFKTKFADKYS